MVGKAAPFNITALALLSSIFVRKNELKIKILTTMFGKKINKTPQLWSVPHKSELWRFFLARLWTVPPPPPEYPWLRYVKIVFWPKLWSVPPQKWIAMYFSCGLFPRHLLNTLDCPFTLSPHALMALLCIDKKVMTFIMKMLTKSPFQVQIKIMEFNKMFFFYGREVSSKHF